MPGVSDAAYANTLPLSHPSTGPLYIREHPTAAATDAAIVDTYLVSQNYLEVMRTPVTKGRGFRPQDSDATEAVAIIMSPLLDYCFQARIRSASTSRL